MKLRVLAIVETPAVRRWQARCLEELGACGQAEVTVIAPGLPPYEATRAERATLRMLKSRWLERTQLEGIRAVQEIFPDELPCADVILDLREVDDAQRPLTARYGTWYFSLGSIRQVPCADEICAGSPTVEAELCSIDRRGGVRRLRWGRFPLGYSYAKTLDGIVDAIAAWPRMQVEALAAGHADAQRLHARPPRAVRPPAWHEAALLALRLALRAARLAWEFFFLEASWDVGIVRTDPAALLREGHLGRVRWLHPHERHPFYADPFYLREGEREYVLCEAVARGSRTGTIAALEFVRDGRVLSERTVLSTGSHLSYPFVLSHDGARYAVPESNAAGRVDAYRIQADGSWRHHARLLDGVDACDSTLFEYRGKWWLFCTRRSTGSNLHLYAYVAEDPLGPWRPHRANPIKSDIRSARPAGPVFEHEGALYRPAQDCGDSYGGAIVVHRIVELDERTFREVAVCRLAPGGRYAHGLHTLGFAPGLTIVDGKREYVSLRKAAWQFGRLARRLWARGRSARLRDAIPANVWRQVQLAFPLRWNVERRCIAPCAQPAASLGPYYVEWSPDTGVMGEDWDVCPRDDRGTIMTLRGGFYHPIDIAQFALYQHARYVRTGSPDALASFRAQALWLRDNQRERRGIPGCYVFAFAWEKYGAPAGWISAMAQGEAISVLLRAQECFAGEGFLAAAQRAAQPFRYPVSEGGVVALGASGDAFFEECAVEPAAHILNGHIFALWGLWELQRVCGEPYVDELVRAGVATVRRNLPLYDTGFWSAYSLLETGRGSRHLATLKYHAFHIAQLRVLAQMTGEPIFAQTAARWQLYADRWDHRARLLAATAAGLYERFITHGDTVGGGARSIV